MSSNPELSYVPHDNFAQSQLQILRQDKCCTCIRSRSHSQAKQTSCDKPQTFFKQEQGSWPCASLQTAWCLNLKSMRKLEIFSTHGVFNENFGNKVYFCKRVCASRMRAGTLAILLVQVSYQILEQDGWFKQQYFARCYESRYFPWEFWCF